MTDEIPYADIVILALIAGFILLRLRSVLGQRNENDKPDFFQPRSSVEQSKEPIIQLSEKTIKSRPRVDVDPYAASLSSGSVLQGINDIKDKEPLFSASTFMEGAKMAFEMVFDAFVKGDKQTLANLLSSEIYSQFASDIDDRDKQETRQETTLLSVKATEIKRVKLERNTAQIAVAFESEQVTLERSSNGDIVAGDPSDIHHVNDEWVFERDVTSKNPNWKIIET
jgi:predicted lipid-binding transport protein (Tim44 family)